MRFPRELWGGKLTHELDSSKKRVLVTGGAGYIGAHTCKALSAAGFLPVTFDNLSFGRRDAVKWGPLIVGDILNRSDLDVALQASQPIAVMHFAGLIRVDESVLNPGLYYRNNVVGTLTLLEAMRDHGCLRFVFSSTCATYGQSVDGKVDELQPQNPINPYGMSKFFAEQILKDFAQTHGFRAISLRYFNAAGADPTGEVGWNVDPPANLVPIVLNAASGKWDSVTVFGSDYPTPDGTCIRDFVHVCDLADAHRLALELELPSGRFEAINLGTGSGHSVRDVIEAVQRCTGRRVQVKSGQRRPGDPAQLVSMGNKAMSVLGWRPSMSDLDTIVQTSWNWHVKRFGTD